jgi:hypothetical protein
MAERLFQLTEGDLWRFQLETLTELTKFIKAHGPGRPGALPAVPWHVDNGFSAVARLSTWMHGPDGSPRNVAAILAAYAVALGTEVIVNDLGDGRFDHWVKGTIGERDRIKLTLNATIDDDDDTEV